MNLGSQPTINPLLPSAVEVHLINKDIDLYDLNLSVEPVEKLRSQIKFNNICLLYTSPSPRDKRLSRMPSSA